MAKKSFYEIGPSEGYLRKGSYLEVRRQINYRGDRADFKPFLNVPVKDLEKQLKESQAEEKKVFEEMKKAVTAWDEHGAQTLLLQKAIEYLKTPEVTHTRNEWQRHKDGSWEISNLVYKMTFNIVKSGDEWKLTWELSYTAPGLSQGYWGYTRSPRERIEYEGSKKYKTMEGAQKYIQSKFDQYAPCFESLSPPIPAEAKELFCVNGQLLQGYSLQPPVPQKDITFIALSTNDDIIIIDAEREYGDLVRALRGIVLEISPNSRHHINPLEIARGYGMGENPVALKSELLMSICEQQMGEGQLGAFHKSIIDRCTASVYHDFIKSGGKARQPILSDWRNEIKRQPEREAQELALASELFVEGSLNMFAHETNVDIDSRIIVFDLYEMGDQLKPTALNVTMETIQNRVATNRLAGKYTWVFVDEVYLFFKYYYSAQFLYKAWKRFRKYGAALTAATQNVEECLRSETARLMFANSEFLVLLNQAATDRAELAKLLNISENQMGYVTNAEAGHGLLRVGGAIVPFANEFPRTGALYQLWNTTPTDK